MGDLTCRNCGMQAQFHGPGYTCARFQSAADADEIAALRERVAELTYYLNVAVEDFDSNNGRCSNEAHWSNEARDLLAQQGTGGQFA